MAIKDNKGLRYIGAFAILRLMCSQSCYRMIEIWWFSWFVVLLDTNICFTYQNNIFTLQTIEKCFGELSLFLLHERPRWKAHQLTKITTTNNTLKHDDWWINQTEAQWAEAHRCMAQPATIVQPHERVQNFRERPPWHALAHAHQPHLEIRLFQGAFWQVPQRERRQVSNGRRHKCGEARKDSLPAFSGTTFLEEATCHSATRRRHVASYCKGWDGGAGSDKAREKQRKSDNMQTDFARNGG